MQNQSVITRSPPVVTLLMGGFMVIVTALYLFGQLTDVPCGPDVVSSFARNFIHVSPVHLLINMYAFLQFSSIEKVLGSTQYLILVLSLAVLQTTIEMITRNFIDLSC